MDLFRIEEKENVYLNSQEVTSYKIYEKVENDTGYFFLGQGCCLGWNKSDRQCISEWLNSEVGEE
jgi:hypothetical protein